MEFIYSKSKSPIMAIEASAGSTEKGDVLIRVKVGRKVDGITIKLESKVKALYEKQILSTIKEKLKEMQISDLSLEINDQAAFDYVIKARLETAIRRAFIKVAECK